MKFTTPLRVEVLDKYRFKLIEPFTYHVGSVDSEETITVPATFTTDFASVPRPLWAILPPHGKYAKAAVLHDWMYNNAYKTKAYADKVFLEAMLVLGVPRRTAKAMYWFVRILGRGKYLPIALDGY